MKRCWIHIGMHKTGSSSVQQNLARVAEPVDWCLLSIGGRPNMGPALHAMLSREPHKCHWFAKSGDSSEVVARKGKRWRKELQKAVAELTVENCIISAEALSTFNKESITALRDFIAPLFDEVRVIGYVRPPVAFKISRFQENVKHGNGKFNIADIKLNYRSKFRKFDEVFGASNVILRKFDPATFPNRCAVADFCQQTGIKLPGDTPIRRINESLSREACGILYAYRKFGPGYGIGKDVIKENVRVVRPLLSVSGAKFKVPMALFGKALAEEEADIRWMEKRLGVSLAEADLSDGSEVVSEDDLLTIKRSSCEEFVARFMEIHEVEFPRNLIPTSDPVDPAQAAELVEEGRKILRKIIVTKREEAAAANGFCSKLMSRIRGLGTSKSRIKGRRAGGSK